MNPTIEAARKALSGTVIDQGVHWKILFLGRSTNGTTDIVSCLSRSLRNLGHHVLDIDLKKHRGLLDNPSRAQGGNGPVFVKVGLMRQLIDGFQPQIIVCCAGGLTFTPEDAADLKARGIVLVGLTLSDPDVFPTVHGHAHVFDFHATNAFVAMDMYRKAGVHNTVYFPFGIDRGFVTQDVPLAPELQADIICIGHATARPDRNGMMTTLARQFDVKTYGRGWEIPGSEVVAGERMLQAARHGRIHVNFPLTRAGYINIKCGVFESVAAGGLVCTGRFSEMETFFAYDREIIGYDDADDLSAQLREILADPERYREMTEAAFGQLVGKHLYEHRFMALFDTLRNVSDDTTPWLGADRVKAIRQTLATSYPRAKKVILAGFYGASNLGDELILTSIRQGLEAADPAVQVCVGAENAINVERDHGLQAYTRRNHYESLQNVRTAAAVVVGGGGLWHDYTIERAGGLMGLFSGAQISIAGFGILPLLGRMFDLPYHVVGMGVGPLAHPDARRMVKFLGHQAETIYVRDEESADHLRALDIHEPRLQVAPDVVYALKLPDPQPLPELEDLKEGGRKLVALNLRPWAKSDDGGMVDAIIEALLQLNRKTPIAVVGLPMQAGARLDVSVLQRVADALRKEVRMVVLPPPLTLPGLTGALSQVDALLSMRLHACLVGHRMRKPVVGIAYDPKVAAHFAELSRTDVCLPIAEDPATYLSALEAALAENGRLPQGVSDLITRLEAQATEALGVAARRIAERPAPQVVWEVPGALDMPPQPAEEAAKPAAAAVPAAAATPVKAPAKGAAPAVAAAPAPAPAIVPVAAAAPASPVTVAAPVPAPFARLERPRVTAHVAHHAPEAARASGHATALVLNLPTLQPMKADEAASRTSLRLATTEPLELALDIESNYENPRTVGRVTYELRIGDLVYREDIAASRQPVHLRLFCAGATELDVELRIMGLRNASQPSASWPKATQVRLVLRQAQPVPHGHRLAGFADRGSLERVGEDRKAA